MSKPKLFQSYPKRLFCFGCSFTGGMWPTYPHIISQELNIPFWNYGRAGASNQYIFNTVMQADSFYQFNEDDLIIVTWTNFLRDDGYYEGHHLTRGNMGLSDMGDRFKTVDDLIFFPYRDLATIKATDEFLEKRKTQYHFSSILKLEILDQWSIRNLFQNNMKNAKLYNLYRHYLNKILPSYATVLYKDDFGNKFKQESETIAARFRDGHPEPIEHLEYLETVFDYKFSDNTRKIVQDTNHELNIIRKELFQQGREVWNMTNELAPIFFNESSYAQTII